MLRRKDYKDDEKFKKTRYAQRKRFYAKTAYSSNYGKHYTKEEIDIIINHTYPDTTISEMLGRSVNSIRKARYRYKNYTNGLNF